MSPNITTIFKPSSTKPLLLLFLRFWLTICTILFLLNVFNAIHRRTTQLPFSTLFQEEASNIPFYTSAARLYLLNSTRSLPFLTQHVWPVPFWLVLMFAQLSTYTRQRNIHLHRLLGKLSIGVTIYMMLSVFWMLATVRDLHGPVGFSLDLRYPRKVFSFWSASMVFGVYWIYCLYKMYQTARWKSIQDHKYWALHFVATGFGSGSFRVVAMMYIVFLRYWYPEYEMDVEDHKAMMGYCTWIGFSGTLMFVDVLISIGMLQIGKGRNGKES